ncbi:2,3-bisphosphoglycerate-dependent phosphoglycerate mutase [Dyadobacter frigoris]|uniref:2,3-bisphosphoglycerate-dependent phosphoglycerate mutase n=1 Tax=Dyadobacter frigoris TaxID=2576211 RepID=A0A4U6CZJ4_9BACT|nr:2,3-bisphosphoglycerate-dependent phosphoglycerate mutase [Dyadobacter frigoris]TKT90300.1 2,3-bisphosphoglycerate-dependent phosphoglycerate mutase [Dyadobacter frigoris]GLU52535.1 2,3-bisphosphoglycerate-dependent phosphoglycerate mutase [Dyadobacter frigoris]
MPNLIIVRHGQSEWNLQNKFTGSTDIELTSTGEMEARNAGRLIKKYPLDEAYTSVLVRAIHTLTIILQEINKTSIPVTKTAAFNERSYGDLQGLDKLEMTKKYGSAQVQTWRRSYDVVPPNGESLKNTYDRVVPYYIKEIEPKLRANKNIIIVAHGNSLRALMMYLEKISETKISDVNIATGVPRLYEFDSGLGLSQVSYIH